MGLEHRLQCNPKAWTKDTHSIFHTYIQLLWAVTFLPVFVIRLQSRQCLKMKGYCTLCLVYQQKFLNFQTWTYIFGDIIFLLPNKTMFVIIRSVTSLWLSVCFERGTSPFIPDMWISYVNQSWRNGLFIYQ